ncbi:MAG: hypothetical protein V3U76_17655 [Granulosicoccus sp.]
MKNLLNNPRFVAIMCILAFAALARTGYQLAFSGAYSELGNSEVTAVDPMGGEYYQASTNTTHQTTNSIVQRELITWLSTPPRDPFAPTSVKSSIPLLASALRQAAAPRRSETRDYTTPVKLPVLKALFHNNHNGKAVIDGRLLEVGDHVSGFSVLVITDKFVVLEKHGRHFTLRPIRS